MKTIRKPSAVHCLACDGFGWADDEDIELVEIDRWNNKIYRHRSPFTCIRELRDRLDSHNL